MGANLRNPAVLIQHNNLVSITHRIQLMRNHQHSCVLPKLPNGTLHSSLVLGVKSARCLIEQKYRRILKQGTCNRHTLTLPAGEPSPTLTNTSFPALRQALSNLGASGELSRL